MERFATELDRAPESVRRARHLLVENLSRWGASVELTRSAELAVSELVANAVEHGAGEITLRVWLGEEYLRVAIHDEGLTLQDAWAAGLDGDSAHYGLRVVEGVADEWGTSSDADGAGKTVWFKVNLDGQVG